MKRLASIVIWAILYVVVTAKVISVPFSRSNNDNKRFDAHITKRSRFLQSNAIESAQFDYYYTNVTIGSPPQSVALIIDSGSSDIWVPSKELRQLCGVNDSYCLLGTYDATISTTYRSVPNNFSGAYQSGLRINGNYMTDDLIIGDTHVEALSMALIENGTVAKEQTGLGGQQTGFNGIMGLAPAVTQFNTSRCPWTPDQLNCTLNVRKCYELRVSRCLRPSLLDRLLQQNTIATRAYSLYLNDLDAREGNILFGGIDTAKFKPPLLRVPIDPKAVFYLVSLTSITMDALSDRSGNVALINPTQGAFKIWLDSGTSVITLPDPLPELLREYAGAYLRPGFDHPFIPCKQSKNQSTISFKFGSETGPVISVPISELVIPQSPAIQSKVKTNGPAICHFAIWNVSSNVDTYVLGAPFMRSAYVVFDLDDWSISLAQTIFNANSTSIQELYPKQLGD